MIKFDILPSSFYVIGPKKSTTSIQLAQQKKSHSFGSANILAVQLVYSYLTKLVLEAYYIWLFWTKIVYIVLCYFRYQ